MARRVPRLIPLLFRLRFGQSADCILGDLLEEYAAEKHSRTRLWRDVISVLLPSSRPRQLLYYSKDRRMSFFASLSHDVQYAARTLRNNPGFAAVAVLAVALGIGVNTGIFTVLNGAALRPLPVAGAGDVFNVFQSLRGVENRNVNGEASFLSTREYEMYRDSNHVFSGMAAYGPVLDVTFGGEHPRRVMGQFASCNYFDVVKEQPALGRGFAADECSVPGAGSVIVLNHDFWKTEFASDPAIVGKAIAVNRKPFTVIGVAHQGFQGTEPVVAQFWVPLTTQPMLQPHFSPLTTNTSWLVALGRRKPGVPASQIRADLAVIAGRIDQQTPGRQTRLFVETAKFLGMPEARQTVLAVGALLLAAVGMVLLVACANVANLMLARAAGRTREIAIRLSLGAGRRRLIQQLLTESLVIALLGGAIGSVAAVWSFQAIVGFLLSHLPPGIPPVMIRVGPDFRVLAYSLAITLLTGVVFGLAPALQASRPDLNSALKDGLPALGARARSHGFLRQVLVGAQVTASMVLLIAAGLLLRGLYRAQTIDTGFQMKNVASAYFDLRGQGYTPERATVFQKQLMERLAAIPGVEGVAQVDMLPLSDSHSRADMKLAGDDRERDAEINYVSASFFSVLNIPIIRGRNFTNAETAGGAPVAIVNDSTARALWPGQDPLGKVLTLGRNDPPISVIGMTADAQVSRLGVVKGLYLYLPESPAEQIRANILVRTSAAQPSLPASIRGAVQAIDPLLPVEVSPLEGNLEFWRIPSRIVATLTGCLGALALILASVGVYGVVAYGVSRRTKEIGIRMSLGAAARDVARLILWASVKPVAIGVVLGVAGGAAISQALQSMLFGLSAHDPLVFLLAPLVLMLTGLLASLVPALRAIRVDPVMALRCE